MKDKKELIRAIKFTLFSIRAGLIQIGSFALLELCFPSWGYWPVYLISLGLSVLWNFTLNREFTFKSANNVPIAMIKVAIFYAIFTPVSTILGDMATKKGINDFIVLIITMICNFILEFLYDRYIVFSKSIDTKNEKSKK